MSCQEQNCNCPEHGTHEITIDLRELAIKNAITAEVGMSLEQLLAACTVDKLKVIAGEYQLANRSKMKKGDLVEALKQAILSADYMTAQVKMMDKDQYGFWQEIAQGDPCQDEEIAPELYGGLCRQGYLYILYKNDVVSFYVPAEVQQLLQQVTTPQLMAEIQSNLHIWDYIQGMTNFYGMTTLEEVVVYYNQHNQSQINLDQAEEVFALYSQKPQVVVSYQGKIVNEYIKSEELLETLQQLIEDKPAYVPSKEQLLEYADDLYYEMTKELAVLAKYMLDHFSQDEDLVHDFIEDIQLSVVLEEEFQVLYDLFESYQFKFEAQEQVYEYGNLLVEICNHTRLWSLRGHTRAEMHAINGEPLQEMPDIEMEKQQPVRVEKIGRNEPCPCGSGKKYKKCCGA